MCRALTAAVLVLACLLAPGSGANAQRVTLAVPPVWEGSVESAGPPSEIGLGTAGSPERDYVLHCQGCHRADGSGTPGSVPALAGNVARYLHVAGGREYLVRVPGVAQSALDNGALAALLNWVVVTFDPEHVPPEFEPYSAAELSEARRFPLVRASTSRARLAASMAHERLPDAARSEWSVSRVLPETHPESPAMR
jgi:hypothetical protein